MFLTLIKVFEEKSLYALVGGLEILDLEAINVHTLALHSAPISIYNAVFPSTSGKAN